LGGIRLPIFFRDGDEIFKLQRCETANCDSFFVVRRRLNFAKIYSGKIARFATSAEVCGPKFFFSHDNARPHSAAATFQALRQLTVELLHSFRYSPYLSPQDYHVFGLLNAAFVDEDMSVMINWRTRCVRWLGDQERDGGIVYKQILINGKLQIEKRGQNRSWLQEVH